MIDINALASSVYKSFDKKSLLVVLLHVQTNLLFKVIISLYQILAEELYKPITTKSEKDKIYSSFKHDICSADLVDM